ncbi:MAG TPA: replication-associated recombination protein A [Dehalococcoidia bacterium]|nr:replication-associated recombination protein A [Dehalococcoidia bacterium]
MPRRTTPRPSLFEDDGPGAAARPGAPLAARMRPRSFDEYVGQEHLVAEGRILRRLVDADNLPSIILWGPPGTGKTTLARIIAGRTSSAFVPVSAVSAGVADLRKAVAEARERLRAGLGRTVLFIDEIHRFNKAQQDAILPFVEDGTVVLIGATTENPSFEVIGPLLSRSRVFALKMLEPDSIARIVTQALADAERGLGATGVAVDDDAIAALAASVGGDARIALNAIESAVVAAQSRGGDHPRVAVADIEEALQHRTYLYDRQGDAHYDTISAFIKSLRGSDPDAALYWLARMIEAGEDPLFIVRRMVILASEDVGLADPMAMVVATACQQAVHFIGLPEGFYPMAETALYLALAPKSNSTGSAYSAALRDVEATRNDPVPLHLRNAVTGLMKQMGYGAGYKYAHDYEGHVVDQQHLPDRLAGHTYYRATDQGWEGRRKRERNAPQ